MPLSADEKLEMQEIVAAGVQQGLSRIGLGADNEAAVGELRADFMWVRDRRKAAGMLWRKALSGVAYGFGVAAVIAFVFIVTHATEFARFAAAVSGH